MNKADRKRRVEEAKVQREAERELEAVRKARANLDMLTTSAHRLGANGEREVAETILQQVEQLVQESSAHETAAAELWLATQRQGAYPSATEFNAGLAEQLKRPETPWTPNKLNPRR